MNRMGTIILLLLLVQACDNLPENPDNLWNPLDPNNPDYIHPEVTLIQGPNENEILDTDQVIFSWQGNQEGMEYRYKLDDAVWSEYSDIMNINYDLLDDELHAFYVQGRYVTGDESEEVIRNFEIDAIKPNALFLFPKKVNISQGDNFYIELMVDLQDSISGLSTTLKFDEQRLTAQSIDVYDVSSDGFWASNGSNLIEFTNIDNTEGIVEIDIASVEGNPRNMKGEGKIARINFQHVTGTSEINIVIDSESILRNSDNLDITINNYDSTYVIIE